MAASKPLVEAPSNDEDKIAIIFYPRGPSAIPKRQVTLTRSVPVLAIGRSSKVPSKGFIPADNNAWFDNPVMSRQHAEIIAQFDKKPWSVYLKDVESFHGTFHRANHGRDNEQRLTPKQLVKLENDDIIRFGIDIFRANKTYPPCSVLFKMEKVVQKPDDLPRRGFTVPDDIDDDEDENCENEGDSIDTAFYTKPTLNNPEPKGILSVNSSSKPPFIDLTADDDLPPCTKFPVSSTVKNCNTSSDVIDLTSEPNCESDEEPSTVYPGAPRPFGFQADASAPISSDGPLSLQCRTNLIHTSDGRFVVPPSFTVPSDDEEMWYMYHDDSSDEDAESGISQDLEPKSDISLVSTSDPNELSEVEPSNPDNTLSELDDEYGELGNSEDEIDDDLSAISYSDCSDRSSSDDEEEEEDDDEDEDDEDDDGDEDDESTKSNEQPRIETPVPLSPVFHQPHCETATVDNPLDLPPLVRPSILRSFTPHNPPHDRDPSPSDAALFKRRPLLDNIPNDSRAQQLGEKTGKFEFFAAREQNRAAISQHHSPTPVAAIGETLQAVQSKDVNVEVTEIATTSRSPSPSLSCAPETKAVVPGEGDDMAQHPPEIKVMVPDENGGMVQPSSEIRFTALGEDNDYVIQRPFEAPDATSIKLGDTDTNQYSAWIVSGNQFINNPPLEEPPASQILRCQPADFDMTSAYKFQQSKRATTAQLVSKTRRLPIQDLLAQEPKQCSISNTQEFEYSEFPAPKTVRDSPTSSTSTPAKRSYEEAFNQNEDIITCKLPCWKLSSPRSVTAKDQTQLSHESIGTTAAQNNVTAQNTVGVEGRDMSAVISVQPEASRPTKRMRLAVAVKVAACVALGGAATFSYLVNTAPVF
ncbi:hypothetical protein F4824DRAFT_503292 [Ustulina deusta]|nr:hypothetical protein F4824DRAFT_503292 [Ustulina deusta]